MPEEQEKRREKKQLGEKERGGCSRIVSLRFSDDIRFTLVSSTSHYGIIFLLLILYPNFHFLVKFHFYPFHSDVTDRTYLRIEQLILQIRFNAKQFTAMWVIRTCHVNKETNKYAGPKDKNYMSVVISAVYLSFGK
ncbi:hypothetical protein VNO80_18023 [Phaseolus coccineus]|uniref:Uncharacterized protein n=1 Tax=Phaseolus coccineus TaxID=3886 RepID=A0AAN9MGW0_PHACN